jgi:hypothetical protein
LVLRPDASTSEALAALASAGKAASMDAIYNTAASVVLAQRVSVPA